VSYLDWVQQMKDAEAELASRIHSLITATPEYRFSVAQDMAAEIAAETDYETVCRLFV